MGLSICLQNLGSLEPVGEKWIFCFVGPRRYTLKVSVQSTANCSSTSGLQLRRTCSVLVLLKLKSMKKALRVEIRDVVVKRVIKRKKHFVIICIFKKTFTNHNYSICYNCLGDLALKMLFYIQQCSLSFTSAFLWYFPSFCSKHGLLVLVKLALSTYYLLFHLHKRKQLNPL